MAIHKTQSKKFDRIPCRRGGYSDARVTPCSTRGGINFLSFEKSIRQKITARLKNENRIIEQVKPGTSYQCAETYYIPLSEINTDTKRFQQRESEFSEESVQKIVSAVQTGTFRWQVFDPILLWKSPDGTLYVLSGHSRKESFKRLAAAGTSYQSRSFNQIPARIIEVPEADAIRIALMSNTLSTPETPIERANFYRNLLRNGTPPKEVQELAEKYESKNAGAVLAYAYLSPSGRVMNMLHSFRNAEPTTRKLTENLAQYVGDARRRWPFLTNEHERELWDFMNSTEGQKSIKSKSEFLNKVAKAIEKNTEFGVFDESQPLNMLNTVYKLPATQEHDKRIATVKANIERAIKARDDKFRDYLNKGYKSAQINPILIKDDREITMLRKEYADLVQQSRNIQKEAEKQASLFGIGAINRQTLAPSARQRANLCQNHYLIY